MRHGFFGFSLLLLLLATSAQAELQIFPLRVTLSDKERSTQISLRHKGPKAERYRITTVFYKMEADGAMKAIEKTNPEDKDGSKYFRYSPRQVTLEPQIEQVVRLMARIPADLPEGEYRCHLHFEAMSDASDSLTEGNTNSGAQMMLKARMAIAIPVIIKKGTTSFKVSLDKFKMNKGPDGNYSFSVDMKKEGNGFAYGNFEIVSTNNDGATESLATINGVSSYRDQRSIKMPLQIKNLPSGKIKLLFKDASSPNEEILASTNLTSP